MPIPLRVSLQSSSQAPAVFRGAQFTYARTFTADDVAAFAELSGDRGHHHVVPDANGRLVVHGLLVLSVPTRIGTDIHYLAHTMNWMFIRPVYDGDTVQAVVSLTRVERLADERGERLEVSMLVKVSNQHGKSVVRGESTGVITHPAVLAGWRAADTGAFPAMTLPSLEDDA